MEYALPAAGGILLLLGAIVWVITTLKINRSRFEIEKNVLEAEKQRDNILSEAQRKAQESVKNVRRDLDKEHQEAMKKLRKKESEVEKRFDMVDRKQEKVSNRERELDKLERGAKEGAETAQRKLQELDDIIDREKKELAHVSTLSPEQAKELLLAKLKDNLDAEGKKLIARTVERATEAADEEATKVIINAMQRLAHDVTTENTTSTVTLPKEEMKGKVIGREGRNIRAFEQSSGVDVIIDDSPNTIVVSSFDLFRREVACKSMEKLIKDGRIHPARIEEIVRKTEEELVEENLKEGESIIIEAGFNDVHPELIKVFSKLKYRMSYGQNQQKHVLQVMELCDTIALELGLDRKLARRCGILHDIGKGIDQDGDGTHTALGCELAKRYGESPIVCNAIAAHHEGVEVESVYTVITSVADAISAARPGARRESTEKYFERMEQLEGIAKQFKPVEKVFAMRAGRDLRIAVNAGRISEQDSIVLARDIARSIESNVTYPGEVKVTLVRETRFVEYAR